MIQPMNGTAPKGVCLVQWPRVLWGETRVRSQCHMFKLRQRIECGGPAKAVPDPHGKQHGSCVAAAVHVAVLQAAPLASHML